MCEEMLELAERGMAKRQKNEEHQAKIAAGTVINPVIDERLVVWGEWHLGQRGDDGGGSSILHQLMVSGEIVRGTAKGVDMSDYIYDTDRAVNQIDDVSKAVIYQQYLEVCKTVEERAIAVGCGRHAFRRRLVNAQNQVLCYLKAPTRKSSVRDEMLIKMSTV